MNARKPRKEIRKSATTKLNVKFNSPHFNEGKGDKRRQGEERRGKARRDDVASYSCRSSLLLLLPALALPLSPSRPLSSCSLIQLKLLGDQLRLLLLMRYVQLL